MKLETCATVSVAAALLYLTAQNTANAQAAQPLASSMVAVAPEVAPAAPAKVSADAIVAQAAAAARKDADPQINGSVRDVPAASLGK